ncbi:unnamed protein product, partial [Amoebophrya sp. A25]
SIDVSVPDATALPEVVYLIGPPEEQVQNLLPSSRHITEHVYAVATGSGVSPILAMAKEQNYTDKKKLEFLFLAHRDASTSLGEAELELLKRKFHIFILIDSESTSSTRMGTRVQGQGEGGRLRTLQVWVNGKNLAHFLVRRATNLSDLLRPL